MRKCINCNWEGSDSDVNSVLNHCPNCGDNTEAFGEPEKKVEEEFDLNKDGKIDKKDRKLAARLLGSRRGKKKK